MANVTPIQLFPGYLSDGLTITIPLTDLPGLTAAEASSTGNGMEILRVILDKAQAQLVVLTPETRPTRASLTKGQPSIATGTGIQPGTLRQTYTATFDLVPTGLEPASE
jgi:hypothetical protein